MDKKEEGKRAQGFVALMEKRGITDKVAYFSYLRDQKQQKLNTSEARAQDAKDEIAVLAKLIQGEL